MNHEKDKPPFGIITSRREMENYIPKELLETEFKFKIDEGVDYSKLDIPKLLMGKEFQDVPQKDREKVIKEYLNGPLTKKITKAMLINNNSYEEIKSWYELIKIIYENGISKDLYDSQCIESDLSLVVAEHQQLKNA